jgi:RsiW-degrading membrane proteinase PrsW (M82 family)
LFFIVPVLSVAIVYITAALLPAVFLMRYIYRQDKVEKEPPGLLFSLILHGVAAALIAAALERLGIGILSLLLDPGSPAYTIIFAFLVVAVAEEGMKFILMKRRTWRDPNFNFRFDGVVYAVYISLGFAAFENIQYIINFGLGVALPRAFLAIPGHMGFAVFLGLFYGRAKRCELQGDLKGKRRNLFAGYFTAVFLHGFYDACTMIGTALSTLLFAAFVVVMYVVVIRLIKKESASDVPV